MTDAARCEPPPELRDRDGWHWVQAPVGDPLLARWHVADNPNTEPLWTSTHHVYSGTPRYAAREWGWRYLSPALTPAEADRLRAENARLRAALDNYAHHYCEGWCKELDGTFPDCGGCEARAALAQEAP